MEKKYIAQWSCPSNIALVKYWGKLPNQIPMNPSLSLTLKNSVTTTTVSAQNLNAPFELNYLFHGEHNAAFSKRIQSVLETWQEHFPFLKNGQWRIESENSFPHSAGIASSASAMGALALSLCSIEHEILGTLNTSESFQRKASYLARLASGSAARSIYPGIVSWGTSELVENSSDEYATPLSIDVHPSVLHLNDAILIVDDQPKKVSSSAGHQLMNNHPYRNNRIEQANNNHKSIIECLTSGDFQQFSTIVENEAMSIHSLMMSSTPWYSLLHANTFEIINRIQYFRAQNNIPVCFTLDAGPNVHVIYPPNVKQQVESFIQTELKPFFKKYQPDEMGNGPEQLK
ncbi:diphosphomevalonate decarboxylase [Prolixibacteraceae bacterium JC049]|nr:diphosphomevalonate decarboxylase [Prolixibacteraceae bacterium JC049]